MLRNVLRFLGILALIRIFLRIFFCPPSNRPIWPKTLTPEERKALRRISSAAALTIKDVCAPSPKLRSTRAAAKLLAKHVSEPHMKTREMLITNNIFVCGPKKPTCNDDETEGFVSGSWARWARRPPRPRCRKGPPAKISPAITHIAIPQPGMDLSDPYNLRGISGSYGNSKGVQVPSLSMLAMAPRARRTSPRATTSRSVFLGKERLTASEKALAPPPAVSPVFEPPTYISRVRRSPTSISQVLEPPSSISRVLPPPNAIPQVVKSPKSGSGILQPPSSISQVLESPTTFNQTVVGPSAPGTRPVEEKVEREEVEECMEVSEPSVAIASCAPRGARARLRARLLRKASPHPRAQRSARRSSAGRGRSSDSQASGEHTPRKVRKVNMKRHSSHSCDRSAKIARTS